MTGARFIANRTSFLTYPSRFLSIAPTTPHSV